MFTGAQVNLYVRDVERSVAFYAAAGFEETYRASVELRPVHVEMRLGGWTLGLAAESAARDDHGLDVSADGNAAEIVLWTEDTEAAYAALLAAGASSMREPHHVQDGALHVAWVADPDGNPIEVVHRMDG